MIKYTTRLFAMPSWISGAARILDLGGTFNEYNFSESPEEADFLALASDWAAVDIDLKTAIERFKVDGVTKSDKKRPYFPINSNKERAWRAFQRDKKRQKSRRRR